MSNILLTSNGFFTDRIKEHFLQIIDGPVTNAKATIITTGSQKKQNNTFAIDAKENFV
ncbi:hypothetical protein [Peribacillus muralis]|uniref:hypothetical protein n=1 Tax=Peribacillus muralis TaxID=264697 RepID=UPI00366BC956